MNSNRTLRYRIAKDNISAHLMQLLTVASLLTLFAMGAGLLWKSWPILSEYGAWQLISSSKWSPLTGDFGFQSFIISSALVTILAVAIGTPIALLSALYLTEHAHPRVQRFVFPVLDILAGIPSVVYGLWGTIIIVPWIGTWLAPKFVEYSSGYTLLAGGIVLSVMVIPLMVALMVELFRDVPTDLKEAAAALGATKWQVTWRIVLRKTLPGIIAAVVMAVSKAFGETLAVLMVCGNTVGTPHSLLDGAYPLPALIANNYGEMLSLPMYESGLMFAALIIFIIILFFNILSKVVLKEVQNRFKL